MEIPEGIGVIIRTVGEGQRARYFVRDLSYLVEQWAKVEEHIKSEPAPCRVFEEPDLVERTVRDFLTDDIDEVLCDDQASVDRMTEMVGQISKRARKRIQLYDGPTPIFEAFGGGRHLVVTDFRDKGQAAEIREFIAAVKTGGSMPMGLEEIVNSTRATLAVLRSMQGGQAVEL